MTLAWNGFGAYGTAVGLLAWTLAVVVYRLRPDRLQNRLLALTLVFEGLYIFTGGGVMYFTDDPRAVYALQVVWAYAIPGFVGAYLLLLGTLDTPLSRPWRTTAGRVLILVGLVATWIIIAFRVQDFVAGVQRVPYAPWDAVTGPGSQVLLTVGLLVVLYAILVAFSAWRRATPGSMQRRQNGYFLLAFGVRDTLAVLVVVNAPLDLFFGQPIRPLPRNVLGIEPFQWGTTMILLFVCLFAYGVLKVQLFDIDLKLKWTLSKSTVAAIFLATFFVLSEGTQAALENRTGSTAIAIGGAAILLIFLAPLQRLGDRVSDAALPRVRDHPDYIRVRKSEVYRAALEGALQDGAVTERERDVLTRLQLELGIANAEARALETDLARGRAEPA